VRLAGDCLPIPHDRKDSAMKNLLEVLRMKEEEILRIRREIEALKITARLLNESEQAAAAAPERRLEVRHLLQMP
jgi:hypothetical protein